MVLNKQVPNVFTCLNLLCGCVAIVSSFHGNEVLLAAMVFLAAMFDFLDGLSARAFNAYSDLGKQLDSLADMVTFGVTPGVVLYNLFIGQAEQEIFSSPMLFHILKYFPFIVTVFAAFRLAKFNVDTRQSNSFLGLPTPAAGIFITSFPLIVRFDHFGLTPILTNPYFILITSIVVSILMIVEIPLFALKFRTLSWNDNRIQFIFLILAAVLIVFFRVTAIPVIVLLYIVLSQLYYFIIDKTTPQNEI